MTQEFAHIVCITKKNHARVANHNNIYSTNDNEREREANYIKRGIYRKKINACVF